MQISETPFMTCRIVVFIYACIQSKLCIETYLYVIACDGREAVDKPILNTEKASEILKTSCNCAGVLMFSCAILNDNHLQILLF